MMDYNDYLSGLKRVTFSDIKDIIKEELNNISDYKAFGFRKEDYGNTILFGELYMGSIINPYLLVFDDIDCLCKDFYDLLQKEFPDAFTYNYEHSFSGEYNYHAYYEDGDGNELVLSFPNVSKKNQSWIIEKVHSKSGKLF